VIIQLTASQDLQHSPFGGVVPEIASRNHSIALLPLIDQALEKSKLTWNDIDALAVTNRPGLIGSLIVGLMTIKALAQSLQKPFIGVNHLEGHLLAPFLKDDSYTPPEEFNYPYVALAVSGGHSSIYWVNDFSDYTIVGSTKDDAAGEAFDKFAKMLGLGFPGGIKVDQLAQNGDRKKYDFPRSLIHDDTLMMSFSGLKSAAHRLITKMSTEEIDSEKEHLCASFQEAVIDVLIAKVLFAAKKFKTKKIVITGGVSANSRLRARAEELRQKGFTLVIPPLRFCTDNAAMIGYVGIKKLNHSIQPHPDSQLSPSVDGVAKDETVKDGQMNLGPSSSSYAEDFKIQLVTDNK